MCGICGVVQLDSDLTVDTITQMTNALVHRGPDDAGAIVLDSTGSNTNPSAHGNVGLGHRRLAIIDLSPAGHQPMQRNMDGPVITFNGEIYNYKEIRAELEQAGIQFQSDSDTEVLLAAYETWSTGMLKRLNGMFAFAIWDPARQEMFVARDRIGIKPLYYYTKNGCFVCASETKTLWAYPHFTPELNLKALGQYLSRGYILAPDTIFEQVYKLPSGYFLRVRPGQPPQISQYWTPIPFFKSPQPTNETEALVQLEELLRSAVRYRMISDVPLGGLLSGGIDSSLIVALMQEQSNRPVKTFTIAFDTPQYNEAQHAQAVARHLGTDHHELLVNEQNLLDLITDLVAYYDEPFADLSAIPTRAVSQLARKYVTVALSGDGGDETFVGYRTYDWMQQREQLRRMLPRSLTKLGLTLTRQLPLKKLQRLSEYVSYDTALQAHQWVTSYWPQSMLPDLLSFQTNGSIDQTAYEQTFSKLADINLLQRMAAADLTSYMVDDILTKVDRASMAVALEVRVPLLDHRVVEYTARLPLSLKRRSGLSKYLLRQLLYRRVPQALVDRPKQGFNVPVAKWLKEPLKDLLISYLSPLKLREHNLFNQTMIAQHIQEHLHGNRDHSRKLWNILVFQMWYDHYLA